MLMRELTIDVVPILTGAGIAGLAIGFGAQNLVRDVISGFFLILEDQVRVGDLARINGVAGSVEQINLRTIVLRDGEGAVQVFPNGTITALANLSKQFAYAVVDMRVAYNENIDRVLGTIREVGASMEKDPVWGPLVLAPLDVVGIESLADGAATIRVKFKTQPLNQGQDRQRAAAAVDGRVRRARDPSVFGMNGQSEIPQFQSCRSAILPSCNFVQTPMLKSRSMRKILLFVCLAALTTASPSAQAPRSTTAAAFSVPVVYRKLPNGLRVVISENHAAPVVVVEVMYRIGFRIEPRERTGFAHLFEHLMFQGSEHVGKFEHVRIVNENGGTLNGSTRFDHTNYFEVMPSNALELALWLEADRMRSLKLTPENLKNQQDVVSEEVRVNVLNQPYGAFEWLGLPQKANTNWYNAHNFYGDLSDLQAANAEDVKKFFDTYYAPNNAVLVVAGDTTPDEVMKLAEKHFGAIPSRPLPPRPDIAEPPQTAEKTFTESDKLARTPALAFGYHLPERMTREFFALTLLDPLLVSDESAKLYQALIKENQVASNVSGGFNYGLGNNFDYNGPMLYTFRVDYRPDLKGADVLKVVDKVIAAVQEHGITEEELRQAKVNFRSSFLEGLESQSGFGRADLLAALALYDDDPNRINTILADLEKVTTAEVQAAAKKYLVPSNRTSIDRRPEGRCQMRRARC